MNVRNTIALASLASLAVAGVLQADEPIKVQPQQQPIAQVQQATPPSTNWVEPSRRERRLLQRQGFPSGLQNSVIVQTPALKPTTPTPQHATAPQPNAAAPQPARLQPTPVVSSQVIETRRPSLLERLRSRRAASYALATSPVVITQPAK